MKQPHQLTGLRNAGVLAALGAAFLFGISTPAAKYLLAQVDPWLLAGLFYCGSGLGLVILRSVSSRQRVRLAAAERVWFGAAIVVGGVLAPVLLMSGLALMRAADASLLLNAETLFTALLAWLVFRENFDRRIALGMLAMVAGMSLLSWSASMQARLLPSLLVLGASLAWAIDNNLTRKVSLLDATWLACVKGLVAGGVNLSIAMLRGVAWPGVMATSGALLIGALAYGFSLVLFVMALRHLGTARTSAYFSIAPFAGALAAIVWLHEPVTLRFLLAAALMAVGVWLHLTERHEHEHRHEALEHEHEHTHDEHHQHDHPQAVEPGARHRHWHRHLPLTHQHHHFPDSHHRHGH